MVHLQFFSKLYSDIVENLYIMLFVITGPPRPIPASGLFCILVKMILIKITTKDENIVAIVSNMKTQLSRNSTQYFIVNTFFIGCDIGKLSSENSFECVFVTVAFVMNGLFDYSGCSVYSRSSRASIVVI